MRVDSNSSYFGVNGIPNRTKARETKASQDSVSIGDASSLKASLKASSDVRADKVAQAKALVSDPSYPQEAVLNRVADVLSKSISSVQE